MGAIASKGLRVQSPAEAVFWYRNVQVIGFMYVMVGEKRLKAELKASRGKNTTGRKKNG